MDKMIYNLPIPYEFIENNNKEIKKKDLLSLKTISKRYLYFNSMIVKSSLIFKLIYEIKKGRTIKLINTKFFRKNKTKIQIIINNKIRNLKDNYIILKKNKKILKIKLIILNDKIINFSKMFYNCIYLKEFSLISQNGENLKNGIKEEQNNNKIETSNINHSFGMNNLIINLLNDFSEINSKSNLTDKNINSLTSFKKKLPNICILSFKNEISEEYKEQINNFFLKSHDYLYSYSLPDSIEFQNNIKQLNSINECLFESKGANKIIRENNENENSDYNFLALFNIYERNNIIVSDLSYMFYGCSSLKSILGISKFNTSIVKNMSHMFEK